MNKTLPTAAVLTTVLAFTTGCKKTVPADAGRPPATSAASPPARVPIAPSPATSASEWTPIVHGIPYQLSLKSGVFGFCDDSGSQTLDLATGKQSAGTATCDRSHEAVQSSCDNRVKIYGDTDAGNDDLSVGDHDYTLRGHSRECDLDGSLLVVSTANAVQLIDFAANKVATVDSHGGDKAVLGSGWVAWTSLDLNHPLRLETTTQAMSTAKPAKA